jgi:hypothetical protein
MGLSARGIPKGLPVAAPLEDTRREAPTETGEEEKSSPSHSLRAPRGLYWWTLSLRPRVDEGWTADHAALAENVNRRPMEVL